ncbi:shieldin complex subunit 1 isoform 2-T19 [Ciconia maguari]
MENLTLVQAEQSFTHTRRLCAGSTSLAGGLEHIARRFGWKAAEADMCDAFLNVSKDAHCSLPGTARMLPGASCSEPPLLAFGHITLDLISVVYIYTTEELELEGSCMEEKRVTTNTGLLDSSGSAHTMLSKKASVVVVVLTINRTRAIQKL